MTVADRIKEMRLELGLSQSELAVRAGYSDKTAVSKIENAGNDITMKQVRRIANALGTTDVYLMGWQDFSEEAQRQIKPITDFTQTHEIDYNRVFEALVEKYGEENVKRGLRFVRAFLEASSDQQKIALDILKLHPDGS